MVARPRVPGGPKNQLPPSTRGAGPRLCRRVGQDLNALLDAEPHGRIRVLAYDFNATLTTPSCAISSTGCEDAVSVVGAGLRDGLRAAGPPAVVIDHVLADKRVGIRAVSVHTIPGTDHRAVFAEFVPPPPACIPATGRKIA
jgi:hypothetical protein